MARPAGTAAHPLRPRTAGTTLRPSARGRITVDMEESTRLEKTNRIAGGAVRT